MATRFSRRRKSTFVTVSELLLHFRSTVSGEALDALEERDVSWRRENDALREECGTIDADYRELLLRSRWMEEELSKQTCLRRSMEEDIECFTEKERWLQAKVRSLEADVLNLGRAKKEKLDRVSKEKAFLEARLHKAEVELSKQQSLIRTLDVMKKEIDDCEHALGHVKLEKNDITSNYKVIEERHGRAVRASGVSQRVQVLEMEKKELQAAVSNVKKEKSDDIRSIPIKKIAGEAERRRMLEETEKMKIQELKRRVEALEREKGEIETELRRAESSRNSEVERILNEKMALENQNKRTEEEMKEKISQLANELRRAESVRNTEIEMILNEKMALEIQNREMKEKVSHLANEYDILETEKGEIEAELCRTLHEKVVLGGLKSRIEEFKEKMSELVNRIEVLETEKGETEAELCKANQEKNSEIEMIMKEKMALELEKRTAERRINVLEAGKRQSKMANQEKQQLIKKISKEKMNLEAEMRKMEDESKLANKERQQYINKILKEKTSLQAEMRKVKEQNHEKISDLVKRIEVLVRETEDMEAQVCKAKTDKKNESERLSMLKEALDDQKSRMEEYEKQVSEILKTIKDLEREKEALDAQVREKSEVINKILKEKKALETEKKTMEDEDKEMVLELNKTIDGLKRERTGIEAKLCQTIEEKSEEMRRILKEKTDLEAEKRIMEDVDKKKVLELNKTIDGLKRQRTGIEAKLCQTIKEKSEEMRRILREKTDLEAEKRIMEDEDKKKVLELNKMIDGLKRQRTSIEAKLCQIIKDKSEEMRRILKEKVDLEAEKRITEDEDKKKILELNKTIDGLKRERTGIKAKLCQTIKEKSEEMRRILKEKTDLEVKKRIMEEDGKGKFVELNKIIEVLKREKREMEAEFCQANKEKNEEMKRILNEKIAVQAENLELANRIDILEREKRELEAEITDKDEVVKVVAQENSCLEKKLNMELLVSKSKEEEEVQLSQPVHHPGNVGLLTTPRQTEGACKRKRTNVSKSKSKRKRHFSKGSSGGRCSGIVNASSGGEVEDVGENRKPPIWEVEEDLLAAFEGEPELCLKAVCALYRQHLLVTDPANTTTTSPSSSARGFKPGYLNKAVALAEYLVDADPEARLRKTVADLEQLDPLAVAECRDIAKQHYKQLFQMHTNNEDPWFLS